MWHLGQHLFLLKISGEVNILYGDAGEEIVKRASEVDACLVVTGTRGLGVIRRTVLGSVSQYVLHHSNVPVAIYTDKCFKGKKWKHLKCRSVYLVCIFCLHTSIYVCWWYFFFESFIFWQLRLFWTQFENTDLLSVFSIL